MSTRDRIIITISIAAAVCVVGYWALLRPCTSRFIQSRDALATMREDLGDAVSLRRTPVEKTMHDAGMWTAEESSVFLQELARMAATHGARLVSVSVADPRRVNESQLNGASTIDYGLFEMKVSAKFGGLYAAVRQLLTALHDHEPRLRLTQVGLSAEQGATDEIAATTELQYYVFQRAVGKDPAGETPTPVVEVEPVPIVPVLSPSPFGRGPARVQPETEEAEEPTVSAQMTVPPDLPEVGGLEPGEEEAPEAVPEGPTPVLTGIVGGRDGLLAAISVEGRTRLYAAGDRLSDRATVAVVAREGIQIAVAGARGERTILARPGQPITGAAMPTRQPFPLPEGGMPAEPSMVLPVSAGTVNGPSGAVGLIREEQRTYIARVGDVIGGRLQIVAIESGDVYVVDADGGIGREQERMALPREGG